MKKLSLVIFAAFLGTTQLFGQEKTEIGVFGKNLVAVNEDGQKTTVKIGSAIEIADKSATDTTKIRVGQKEIEIVESGEGTHVDVKHSDWKDKHKKKDGKFNGHWAGIDLGVNGFDKKDYGMYGGRDFMDLDQNKSWEVNINFLEYNIGLQKERHNIGLVTGLGLWMNNYKFDNSLTIDKVDGIVKPVDLTPEKLKKSKLTVSYLTIPLLLELQTKVNDHSDKLYIAGGVVGGLNIGSHTKIKWDGKKEKDHGDFNINPFKCVAMAKVGFKDVSLYATYSFTELFETDKGPGLTPFSIGLTIVNF